MAVIYYALRNFGAAAQAGFGIGSRLLGVIQMPALSMAFAAGAIAGQNFGAGNRERVRETFRSVLLLGTAVMIAFTMVAQWQPEWLLGGFTKDPETIAIGALFLRMVSLNIVAQGVIFVCSSMFQGLGNTRPVLLSSGVRLVTYGLPLIWLSATSGFSHRARLVSVDCDHHAAGRADFVVAAPGVQQAAGAAAAMKQGADVTFKTSGLAGYCQTPMMHL